MREKYFFYNDNQDALLSPYNKAKDTTKIGNPHHIARHNFSTGFFIVNDGQMTTTCRMFWTFSLLEIVFVARGRTQKLLEYGLTYLLTLLRIRSYFDKASDCHGV